MDATTELPKPGSRVSVKEYREGIYDKLERKIGVVKSIWQFASELPVPGADEEPAVQEKEEDEMNGIVQGAMNSFGDAKPGLARLKDLESEMHSARLTNEVLREFVSLVGDDDISFLRSIQMGVQRAMEKRRSIRIILKKLGQGRVQDPEAYRPFLPSKLLPLADSVERVEVGSFSVNLTVEEEAFASHMGDSDDQQYKTYGFHSHDSVWNLIRGESMDPDETSQTVIHEELHSFAEGFVLPEESWVRDADLEEVLEQDRLALNITKDDPQAFRRARAIMMGHLRMYADSDHEELVAELVSLPHRNLPLHTFRKRHEQKDDFVSGMDDPLSRAVVVDCDYYTLEWIEDLIGDSYAKLMEKAPERIVDLDLALCLLPPSKYRHVERLVKRWAEE